MFPSLEIAGKSENKDDEDNLTISLEKLDVDVTKDRDIMGMESGCETVHQEFTRLFSQALKDSSFMRCGKHQVKSLSKRRFFQKDDFILVMAAQGIKYGLVQEVNSPHTISVKLLNRHKKIKTQLRIEKFSAEQCTLLHRKPVA